MTTALDAVFSFLTREILALRPALIPRDAITRANRRAELGDAPYYALLDAPLCERSLITERIELWRGRATITLGAFLGTDLPPLDAVARALILRLDRAQRRGATLRSIVQGEKYSALIYCDGASQVESRVARERYEVVISVDFDVFLE